MPVRKETRSNIIQTIRSEGIDWSGKLDDVEFLSRIFDLTSMPSNDNRYDNAKMDITQHTVWAPGDWSDYWVFDDKRFDLMNCSDEKFLRVLCEMIHPVVRPDEAYRNKLLAMFNDELKKDEYQIVEGKSRFGNAIYYPTGLDPSTVRAIEHLKEIADATGSTHIQQEIVRMESAVDSDPDLAIGTAKELLESMCKTILKDRGKSYDEKVDNLPKLIHLTVGELRQGEYSFGKETEDALKKMFGSLSTLVQTAGELRNLHGTGHGKDGKKEPTPPEYAALAVNSASTIALFLYRLHERRK